MLASLIHCLTFAAFGAHVLLGCCAHHHHDVSSALCSHQHVHAQDAGQNHGDHDHGADESSDHQSVDTDHPATPCDHSHACEQGDCTFVSSDSRVVPSTPSGTFVLLPSDASTSADVRRFLHVARCDNLSTCCLLVGHRCALQQSWQI